MGPGTGARVGFFVGSFVGDVVGASEDKQVHGAGLGLCVGYKKKFDC